MYRPNPSALLFDSSASYRTVRPLVWGSREYGAGEPFPIPEGADPETLYQIGCLYQVGEIEMASDPAEADSDGDAVIVEKSTGWYLVVDREGNDIGGKAMRLADAEKVAAELNG